MKNEDIEKLALEIAKILHEINGLKPASQQYEKHQDIITYGFTIIRIYPDPQIYASIKLNYQKLCEQNLYPLQSPIEFIISHEEDTPLGKNRQILSAIAACIGKFLEWLLEEYPKHYIFYTPEIPPEKLREYIEQLWLQGKTLNNLTPQKIQFLKGSAPFFYKTLEKALKAIENLPDTHLTVRQYLKSICIEAYTDTTDKTPDQITQQARTLAAQATKALQKLAQQHPPQQTHPCKTRHHHTGPWTIATW